MIISSKGWATTKHSSGTVDHISICTHACSVQCVANLHMQIYHTPVSASCLLKRFHGTWVLIMEKIKLWNGPFTHFDTTVDGVSFQRPCGCLSVYTHCVFQKISGLFRCHYISIRIYFYVYLFCLFFLYSGNVTWLDILDALFCKFRSQIWTAWSHQGMELAKERNGPHQKHHGQCQNHCTSPNTVRQNKTNKLLLVKKKGKLVIWRHIVKKMLHIRLVVLWSHYPEQHGHGTNHYEYTNNSIAKLDAQRVSRRRRKKREAERRDYDTYKLLITLCSLLFVGPLFLKV